MQIIIKSIYILQYFDLCIILINVVHKFTSTYDVGDWKFYFCDSWMINM
jgi:hypothetical protein